MRKDRHTVAAGAIRLAVAGVLCKLLGVAFKVPLANSGGGALMASYQIAMSVFAPTLLALTAGLPTAAARMIAAARNEPERARILRAGLLPATLGGAVLSLALFFFAEPISRLAGSVSAASAVRAVAPAPFACALGAMLRAAAQGRGDLRPTARTQVAESAVRLCVGLPLATRMISRGAEYGAAGALVGVSAGSCFALLLLLPTARRVKLFQRTEGAPPYRALLSCAAPLTAGAMVHSLSNLADHALLLRRLGGVGSSAEASRLFGIFTGYCMTFFSFPPTLIGALCASLLPAVTARYASAGASGAAPMARRALMLSCGLSLCFVLPFLLCPRMLMGLLYSREEEIAIAAPLLASLAPALPFLSLSQVAASLLTACGAARMTARATVAGCAVRILVTATLAGVPAIGIYSAPLATAACAAVTASCNLFNLSKLLSEEKSGSLPEDSLRKQIE